MRVVLDTNILVSALIAPKGLTDRVYRAWRDKRFVLVTSEEQLEEFRRVTRYPRVRDFILPAAAGTMHKELRRLAMLLQRLPDIDESPDPADNFLLAMAQAGAADFLVTGDKHDLLLLGSFRETRIVTARQLLGFLAKRYRVPKRPGTPLRRGSRRRLP